MEHAVTMRRTYELISEGDVAGFGDLVADGFVEHQGGPGFAPDKEGTLDFFRAMVEAFPDLRMTVEDLVAVVGLVTGAVVGDPVLGEVVGADPLGAVHGAHLRPTRLAGLGVGSGGHLRLIQRAKGPDVIGPGRQIPPFVAREQRTHCLAPLLNLIIELGHIGDDPLAGLLKR